MLPQTGTSDAIVPIVVLVAAALIVMGIALLRPGGFRRRVLTGVGALAVVGALALGTVASAPSAQADAGPTDCITAPAAPAPSAAPAPTVTPEPTAPQAIAVTPSAPTTAAQCGLAPSIAIPTQEGVTYAQSQVGSILTVVASAQPGYVLAAGAQTQWTFDVTPTPVAAMPVELPESIGVFRQFGDTPAAEWRLYVPDEGVDALDALEAASAQGVTTSYETGDEIVVTYEVFDPATNTDTTVTRNVPWSASLAYDAEPRELVVTIADFAALAIALDVARADVMESNPGASVFQTELDLGLTVIASFVPGPGCGVEIQSVPVTLLELT